MSLHLQPSSIRDSVTASLMSVAWHKSSFGSSIFVADFGKHGTENINLSIQLRSGQLLTSPNSHQLMFDIEQFLCLQGVSRLYSSRNSELGTQKRHFIRALKIVDYLLINSQGSLNRFGLSGVTTNDLNSLLKAYTSNGGGDEGLYEWRKRLRTYLLNLAEEIPENFFEETMRKMPSICTNQQCPALEFSSNQLLRARVALYKFGLEKFDGAWSSNTLGFVCSQIRTEIYDNTLLTSTKSIRHFKFPDELLFGPSSKVFREFDRVYVPENYESESIQEKGLNSIKGNILSAKMLSSAGLTFHQDVLREFEHIDHSKLMEVAPIGGFRHAPPALMAYALKQAIVFYYEHADHLLKSCANVLTSTEPDILRRGKRPCPKFHQFLEPKTVEFGVGMWALNLQNGEDHGRRYAQTLRETRAGLLDMVLVLFGACLITVGILEAPRDRELLSIKFGDITDDEQFLALFSRKTGIGELRRRDEIPLAKVCADILKSLHDFHESVGNKDVHLFTVPGLLGTFSNGSDTVYAALDRFLDFIEMETDDSGKRHYFRQHQFRKFFAAVFFHSFLFAGLEPLRWMLRQVDLEQIWAYVRSSIPGELLNHYFAVTTTELLRQGAQELFSLSELLQHEFGVHDLVIVSEAELISRIEHLQKVGRVEIKPIFVTQDEFVEVHVGVTVFEDYHNEHQERERDVSCTLA